jgi:hypothetical protein
MTWSKLNISEFQNTKTKNFQSSHEERHIPHFLTCENSHKKNLKTPKMIRRKLEILELQIRKQFFSPPMGGISSHFFCHRWAVTSSDFFFCH